MWKPHISASKASVLYLEPYISASKTSVVYEETPNISIESISHVCGNLIYQHQKHQSCKWKPHISATKASVVYVETPYISIKNTLQYIKSLSNYIHCHTTSYTGCFSISFKFSLIRIYPLPLQQSILTCTFFCLVVP